MCTNKLLSKCIFCLSAFVMKTSSNLFSGWSHTISVIGVFVWLIEPRWCVIKFVLNKNMLGYIVAIGYVFTCELQTVKTHSDYLKIFYQSVVHFMPFHVKILCHGSHDSGSKVWLCYIQFCVIMERYNGARLYREMTVNVISLHIETFLSND